MSNLPCCGRHEDTLVSARPDCWMCNQARDNAVLATAFWPVWLLLRLVMVFAYAFYLPGRALFRFTGGRTS